jgi:hypothetical protein
MVDSHTFFFRFLTTTTALSATMGAGWQRCRLRGGSFVLLLRRYGVGGQGLTISADPPGSHRFNFDGDGLGQHPT